MSDLENRIGLENPEQPHCAVVLVLDVSGSMTVGDKIGQLNDGLQLFKEEVMGDDLARKRVDLAVVTFGHTVEVIHEFSSVESFDPPALQATGQTPMGEAIVTALEMVERRKNEYKMQGTDYYRPWIFLLTDGEPTDMRVGDALWNQVVEKVHGGEKDRKFMFFAVAVEPARTDVLAQIAAPTRPPLRLREDRFGAMFEWLSKSQGKVSASNVGDQVQLDDPLAYGGWAQVPTT
jgi:uncharacterized protein YegL